MLERLKKLDRSVLIVFSLVLACLVVKSLLITTFTTDTHEFLRSYRFVFSDSYDWLANGLRIFQNDGISFRNPGLVLLIKFLHSLHILFLLPLINNLAFFALIVYLYRLCRLVSSQLVALILVGAIALNYSLNLGADAILADIYTVAFITISFYYLVTKKYFVSFAALGVSMLFQNIGYFLLIIWGCYYAKEHFAELKVKLHKKDFAYFIKGGVYTGLALLPVVIWHIYKFIRFGNPLYSKIPHFEVLHPNFNSLDFYALNSLSMFGFVLIPLAIFALFNIKKMLKQKVLLWSLVGLTFNFLFWVIAYDWDDRRFLVYFIPFLFPFIAYYLQRIRSASLMKLLLVMVLFYPTILPLRSFLSSTEQPVLHNFYIQIDPGKNNRQKILTAREREGFENPLMDLDPILYSAVTEYDINHTPGSTPYAFYTTYIDKNYDQVKNTICIDTHHGIRKYLVRTILMLNKNIDLETVEQVNECTAKI